MKVKSLSRLQLVATPWTAAYQAPPSMGFSRQEYWSGLPYNNRMGKIHIDKPVTQASHWQLLFEAVLMYQRYNLSNQQRRK